MGAHAERRRGHHLVPHPRWICGGETEETTMWCFRSVQHLTSSSFTARWALRRSRVELCHVLAVLYHVERLSCFRSDVARNTPAPQPLSLTDIHPDWNSAILILRYWVPESSFPSYAWALIFWAVFSVITLLGVNVYGELEYFFGMFKFLSLIILFILSIVANVGGFGGGYVGFRYWTKPNGRLELRILCVLAELTRHHQVPSSTASTDSARSLCSQPPTMSARRSFLWLQASRGIPRRMSPEYVIPLLHSA